MSTLILDILVYSAKAVSVYTVIKRPVCDIWLIKESERGTRTAILMVRDGRSTAGQRGESQGRDGSGLGRWCPGLGCVGSGKCTGRGLIPFLPVSSRTGDIPPTYARDTRFHASHRALLC